MRYDRFEYPSLRLPILFFVALVLFLQFPGARDLVRVPYSGIETRNLVVQNVDQKSPNASKDIRRGDEIVSVGGEPIRNYNHFRYVVSRNTGFSPQEYGLVRGDDTVSVVVDYTPVPPAMVHRRFGHVVVGFTFLLTGLLVLARRADAIGILFSLNCVLLCYLLSSRPIFPGSVLQLVGELFDDAVTLVFPATFLHFFLVFPERARPPRRWRVPRWAATYGTPVLLYAATSVLVVRRFFLVPSPKFAVTAVLAASTVYTSAYLIASLAVFARSYRSSPVGQRERLRIAIAGTVAGIVPFLAMMVWRQVTPGSYTLWEFICSLAPVFVSVSFAYAILKHGAIELNIVVRKSLGYAFLTGAIVAAYYGLVRYLGDFFTREFNLQPPYFSIVAVLVLAVIFAPARQLVQGIVDRLFFRGEYDYRREVVEFNRQLSQRASKSEILAYFSEKMRTLLKSSFVAYYAKSGAEVSYRLTDPVPESANFPEVFPSGSLLGRYLCRFRKPLMVEYLDLGWRRRHLDGPSRAFLGSTGAAVCLPVGSGEAPRGFFVLGPKRSGVLYTQLDAEILETFSEHLGLVLENAELHETALQQERLRNEVLLAREIQLGLLPERPPRHPKLALVGKMVSSVEVGGDYFDYFELPDDRIGMVIGDVSGKGVPAAMLVASLQAVFKNLALRDEMNPSQVMSELNKYLCETAKVGQYASFFYAIAELDSGILTFCNAGHCPPLLVKQHYVDRLGEGGMILGVDPARPYREGRVKLDEGDLLCLYTDGVTEQVDPRGEQFGESRLVEFLKTKKNLPLQALHESLFATVIAFGNGFQHDDISVIIARSTTG